MLMRIPFTSTSLSARISMYFVPSIIRVCTMSEFSAPTFTVTSGVLISSRFVFMTVSGAMAAFLPIFSHAFSVKSFTVASSIPPNRSS